MFIFVLGLFPPRALAVDIVGYDVLIIAGQSNAVGYYSQCNSVPASYSRATDPRILQVERQPELSQINYHTIGIAKDGLDHHIYPSIPAPPCPDFVGPGMTLARKYLAQLPANRGVILIPAGFAGSSIAVWAANDSWFYNDILFRVFTAMLYQGKQNRLAGMVWQQGETDYLTSTFPQLYSAPFILSAADYGQKLKALLAGFQHDLDVWTYGRYHVPILVGQFAQNIVYSDGPGKQVQKDYYGAMADASASLPCSSVVSSVGLHSDTMHFFAADYIQLGALHAQALINLQRNGHEGNRCKYDY